MQSQLSPQSSRRSPQTLSCVSDICSRLSLNYHFHQKVELKSSYQLSKVDILVLSDLEHRMALEVIPDHYATPPKPDMKLEMMQKVDVLTRASRASSSHSCPKSKALKRLMLSGRVTCAVTESTRGRPKIKIFASEEEKICFARTIFPFIHEKCLQTKKEKGCRPAH
jgi:hypothetical protein